MPRQLPTRNYNPTYQPWQEDDFTNEYLRILPYTLVSKDRAYVLWTLAIQALPLCGEYWECGVYKGGTAMLLNQITRSRRRLRLFDTFNGMPETSEKDWHQTGEFSDTSYEAVKSRLPDNSVSFHIGKMPDTFDDLRDSTIAFAHIDVDIYESVWACLDFITPRLQCGGFIVIDDYGFDTCLGAREATDAYFSSIYLKPLVLANGQAVIFKGF